MELRALLCDAARSAAGRIHVLGGWNSYRLQGPRKRLSGAIVRVRIRFHFSPGSR